MILDFHSKVPIEAIKACADVAEWMETITVGSEVLLIFGSNGMTLCSFPSPHINEHKVAFARKTKQVYGKLKGCGLRARWPTEPKVTKWLDWLGVRHEGDWAVL